MSLLAEPRARSQERLRFRPLGCRFVAWFRAVLLPGSVSGLRVCEPSVLVTVTVLCFTHSQCRLVCISYPERKEAPLKYALGFSRPFRLSTRTKGEVLTELEPRVITNHFLRTPPPSALRIGCWGDTKLVLFEVCSLVPWQLARVYLFPPKYIKS